MFSGDLVRGWVCAATAVHCSARVRLLRWVLCGGWRALRCGAVLQRWYRRVSGVQLRRCVLAHAARVRLRQPFDVPPSPAAQPVSTAPRAPRAALASRALSAATALGAPPPPSRAPPPGATVQHRRGLLVAACAPSAGLGRLRARRSTRIPPAVAPARVPRAHSAQLAARVPPARSAEWAVTAWEARRALSHAARQGAFRAGLVCYCRVVHQHACEMFALKGNPLACGLILWQLAWVVMRVFDW